MTRLTGFEPSQGDYDDAVKLVEGPAHERRGDVEVDWTTIRHFCVAVEDGNPSYWDPAFAKRQWGGIVAPPAMLMAWVAQFPWTPHGRAVTPTSLTIPLPGTAIVNIRNMTEYLLPVHVGDRLAASDVLEAVSPLKVTAVGEGHFVTTRSTYTRQDGAVVAIERNTLLRYTPLAIEP